MATPLSSVEILRDDRNLQIGNVCIQWSHLEYLMLLSICSVLRVDEHTAKLLAGSLNIRARAKLAWDLAEHLEAPAGAISALKAAHDKIGKLDDRRNRVIHGHRLTDPSRSDAETFELYRGKGIGNRVRMTNSDLARLGVEINATARALHTAMLNTGVFHAEAKKPARITA